MINELCNEAYKNINNGNIEKALKILREIENLQTDDLYKDYYSSGIYIDIGSILYKEELIKKGIHGLENNLFQLEQDNNIKQSVYYNLGNGYNALFSLKRRTNPFYGFMTKDIESHKAINFYNKSLKCKILNPEILVYIFVNMANLLDSVGRSIEAIEYYDKALSINPNFGMALANKGMSLKYYARLTGDRWVTHYKDSYNLMKLGLDKGVYKEAEEIFLKHIKEMEKYVDFNKCKDICNLKTLNITSESDLEKFSKEFCIKHKLYLNLCNHCQKCNSALGDDMAINKMIISVEIPLENDPFLKLSSFINEIKQNYITARFLLIQSRFNDDTLNFVDKDVTIVDTLNYVENNIYVQLVKFAFKNMFDILDKIAIFINEYLKMDKKERYIDFNSIWYENSDRKREKIHNKILETNNFNLNALFNIYLDLNNGRYEELVEIRHALTHRFLDVYWMGDNSIQSMSEEYLVEQTIRIAKVVRNAIIYLLSFVDLEESKKEKNTKEKIGIMNAFNIPDELKHY